MTLWLFRARHQHGHNVTVLRGFARDRRPARRVEAEVRCGGPCRLTHRMRRAHSVARGTVTLWPYGCQAPERTRESAADPRPGVKRHRGGADSASRLMSAGLPPPASDAAPTEARRIATRARLLGARLLGRTQRVMSGRLEDILDLFDEDVYSGEITADGRYVGNSEVPRLERYIGGEIPAGAEHGAFWESRIHRDDWADYERFNRQLLEGHRRRGHLPLPRPRRRHALPLGSRPAAARTRRPRVHHGHHLRRHVAPRGGGAAGAGQRSLHAAARRRRRARVPGRRAPRRPVGGAVPGPRAPTACSAAPSRTARWRTGTPRSTPTTGPRTTRSIATSRPARAPTSSTGCAAPTASPAGCTTARVAHRKPDGSAEISGIVSDVTERRRMRAELAQTHASLSQVVEAMDAHLFTLRVEADGTNSDVYRGPNREALIGGALEASANEHQAYEALVHPDDRARWRAGVDATRGGRDDRPRVPRVRPGRSRAHRLRAAAAAARRRRHAVLRRRQPRHHRAPPARGRAAAQHGRHARGPRRARGGAPRGRAARPHGRAHGHLQPAPLQRGDRGRARRAARAAARLVLLDADHFKQVNDAYGHLVGDAVLVELARRLQHTIGPEDCLARWGGEEFAVLLRGIESDAELHWRADGLRAAIAARARRGGGREPAADGVDGRRARGRRPGDAGRARRRRRPLPVRREAARAQPGLAGAAPRDHRRGAATPRRSAWRARWPSSRARRRACRAGTPSWWRRSAPRRPSASGCPARSCSAAGSAAGCTTSARRRSRRRSSRSPARWTSRSGPRSRRIPRSARRSSATSRRCAMRRRRCGTTTSASTATATPTGWPRGDPGRGAHRRGRRRLRGDHRRPAVRRRRAARRTRRSSCAAAPARSSTRAAVDALLDVLGIASASDARVA